MKQEEAGETATTQRGADPVVTPYKCSQVLVG
jgi:hypothetical protein